MESNGTSESPTYFTTISMTNNYCSLLLIYIHIYAQLLVSPVRFLGREVSNF